MGWENRGKRKYLYRTKTVRGRSSKKYYGTGLGAEMVEAQWALARAETADRQEQAERIREAVSLTKKLCAASQMMFSANLLVCGYHQASRHVWRAWSDGRRILELCD